MLIYDVAVIGAGVVGAFVARELTRYCTKVCILEKCADVAMGATKANSAIVHAGFDAKEGTLKAKLNVRGSEMMESVAGELGVKYKRCGSLVLGFDENDRETLKELINRGNKNGVRGLTLLERDELRALEPNVGDEAICALHAPTGAIICPYELCMAAVGNAMDNGAELIRDFEVKAIESCDGGYKIISDGGEVFAKYVVNCAGAFSDEIAKMVGDDSFTVTPRRGEYMLLDKESGALVKSTIFRCPTPLGKGILVTPTVDGNLLLGPTAENIEDKFDTATTAEGLATLKAKTALQAKGVDFSKVITSFCGLRSVGSTGDFIINSPKAGFINCAGIESPGLTSAPAIGEYVAELLKNAGLELVKNESFSGCRKPMHYFRELSDEDKCDVIEKNPEFAHIICRCEMISEGEILEAIRTNPKPRDVDGVKRRTRAGMGRCQGGFCSPYVVELLGREMGVGFTEITKSGGKSYINVGRTKEI